MQWLRIVLSRSYPATAWLIVLASVFAIEYGIMVGLPLLLPQGAGRLITSLLDAAVLTIAVAPILWWFVVRPLRALLDIRTQHLADLFTSIEQERRRVAMELHDGVGQSLTMLVSGLRTAKDASDIGDVQRRCGELQRVSQDALGELKRINLALRPSLLDDLGLAPAVTRLAEDVTRHHGLKLALDLDGLPGFRLPRSVETAVFRIVQEALSNVVKHSGASSGTIRMEIRDEWLVAIIEDDGRGFSPGTLDRWHVSPEQFGTSSQRTPPASLSGPLTLGLRGMRERAALIGGRLTIRSKPSHGTSVIANIPIGATRGRQDPNHAG
jgi:signal transduction histidine kinase